MCVFLLAGKTSLVKRLVQYRDEIFTERMQHIIYCYGETPGDIGEINTDIELFKGLPSEDELSAWISNYKHQPWLLILDDLSQDFYNSPIGSEICTKLSHHYSASIILISHSLYGAKSRLINLNMHNFFLLPSSRGLDSLGCFSRQCLGKGLSNSFVDSFLDATDKKGSGEKPPYLLVTLHPLYSNRQCLLFSNVLPDEHPMVTYKKV